jgi:uncharacterized membrane protein
MSVISKWFGLFFSVFLGIIIAGSQPALAAGDITLYTPYTKITVPPGEVVDYTIDIINNSEELKTIDISISGLSRTWTYDLKAGGYNISQISVLPGEKKSINLTVEVPLKVNKGNYRFQVVAGDYGSLPLLLTVSEQGTFKTEFTTDQPNMEGTGTTLFTYKAYLKNRTGEKQLYALMANAPRGWNVVFKANYIQATSVEINANGNADISIEINPPDMTQAGTYKIPVRATTNATSADLELEVVITGTYGMGLTTPTGLLSAGITAGDQKRLELVITNSGSAELNNINLTAAKPINWDVVFEPNKIEKLEPGSKINVFATVTADKKAIAGDYAITIDANTPEVSSKVSFRISVKTPLLYGWIGILIIIVSIGSVYYLFRRYGRR